MMHYVCIENNKIVSILNYEPNVPNSVSLVQITDAEHLQLQAETHYSVITQKQQELQNIIEKDFLSSTDWKVLRHIRQTALGIATSLTEEEYLALERQRQAAAQRII
jgi:hypothetical protein